MKTPLEVILERHHAVEAKLKAIRAEDLAAEARGQPQASCGLAAVAQKFWLEALWPWRRVWAGVAATWVTILGLTLATAAKPGRASVKLPQPGPEVLAVLQQQEQLMTQLLGVETPPPPSHPRTPGPRSGVVPAPARGQEASQKTTLRAEVLALA